jgi:hypothetical protein
MDQGTIRHSIERFQLAFSEQYQDQIHQLVQESVEEAFALAKEILRAETLNTVLAAAGARAGSPGNRPPENRAVPHSAGQAQTEGSAETPNAPAPEPTALNDRILQEIEAIREQILRNEQLLGQIKPFLKTSTTPEV